MKYSNENMGEVVQEFIEFWRELGFTAASLGDSDRCTPKSQMGKAAAQRSLMYFRAANALERSLEMGVPICICCLKSREECLMVTQQELPGMK